MRRIFNSKRRIYVRSLPNFGRLPVVLFGGHLGDAGILIQDHGHFQHKTAAPYLDSDGVTGDKVQQGLRKGVQAGD